MFTVEELDLLWEFLQGRMPANSESMKIAEKVYHLKQAAKAAGKKEVQIII